MGIKIKGKDIVIPSGTPLTQEALESTISYYLSETVNNLNDWDVEHLAMHLMGELDIKTKGKWTRPKSESSEWKLKKVL